MKWHFLQWRMRLDFVSVGGIQLTNWLMLSSLVAIWWLEVHLPISSNCLEWLP